MLTFINTTVNIKDEDGYFVPYEMETISGKAKDFTITNFTGSKILVVIKKNQNSCKGHYNAKPSGLEQHAP